MARLNSWLSPDVMHALGWALIHSLWQCVALAALAAALMAFSRRPSVRYLVATGALAAMLVALVATFFILVKPTQPAHVPSPAGQGLPSFAVPAAMSPSVVAGNASTAAPVAMAAGAVISPLDSYRIRPARPAPDFLPSSLLPWLVAAWLSGVALFSLRFAGGFLLLEYRRRTLCEPPNAHILSLCHDLQRKLGLDRAVLYLECAWIQAPAVIGWLGPIVLLPIAALSGLSEAQLRAVIAHELAHIRRHDFFINLLQVLVETLLFYHPAIWWLNARIRAERELCCDEIAVSLTGDRLEYARVLTLMAEWEQAPALAMAANRGPLTARIFHILGRKSSGLGQRMLGLTGAILFLAAALGAANALFGIAYPIAKAEAKAVAKIVPTISRAAIDQVASLASQAAAPVVKAPDQNGGRTLSRPDLVQAETPVASLPDVPQPSADVFPPPAKASAAPEETASNDPAPAPTPAPAPANAPSAAQVALNDPPAATGRSCALPAIADTVGLTPVRGSNLMTVPVQINGQSKQFLLDLGTNPTTVSRAAVAELGLPENTRMTSVIQFGGNGSTSDMGVQQGLQMQAPVYDVRGNQKTYGLRSRVRVGQFTIGTATAPNLMFMVANSGEIAKAAPYDGILTNDIFRQYDAELDFAGKQITFLTPAKCTDPDQVVFWAHDAVGVIPMTLVDGRIQVPVTIEGHPVDAVIDTSSPRSVMRRDIAERMLGYKAGTPEMMADGDTKDGMGQPVFVHNFSRISFAGGVTAVNVPALIQTNSMLHDNDSEPVIGSRASSVDPRIPDLTLGMDVLSQLHVYAVFGQKKLYVTANK
ncbi:MAG TPA: M56 family metallopeptidase [Rhizomicrobium sp.]|nr:M56 family metallopeptidase [Rhizomicrobium sp.]